MFTKRHYIAIADCVRPNIEARLVTDDAGNVLQCDRMISDLADLFAQDNPRFDRDRFVDYCYNGRSK